MKNKKKIFVIIVSVISLFSILLFVYLISNKNEKDNSSDVVEIENDSVETVNFDKLDNAKVEDGSKINTSSLIKKEHLFLDSMTNEVIPNIVMREATIYSKGTMEIYFKAIVENKGDTNFTNRSFEVSFYDKAGTFLHSFQHVLDKDILPGEEVVVEYYTTDDYINAYDYTVFVYT